MAGTFTLSAIYVPWWFIESLVLPCVCFFVTSNKVCHSIVILHTFNFVTPKGEGLHRYTSFNFLRIFSLLEQINGCGNSIKYNISISVEWLNTLLFFYLSCNTHQFSHLTAAESGCLVEMLERCVKSDYGLTQLLSAAGGRSLLLPPRLSRLASLLLIFLFLSVGRCLHHYSV